MVTISAKKIEPIWSINPPTSFEGTSVFVKGVMNVITIAVFATDRDKIVGYIRSVQRIIYMYHVVGHLPHRNKAILTYSEACSFPSTEWDSKFVISFASCGNPRFKPDKRMSVQYE